MWLLRKAIPRAAAIAAPAVLLAGCAVQPVPVSAPPPPPLALDLPAPIPPRPVPPEGVATTFVPPPHLPNGQYLTVNTNLPAQEVVWHMRSALNVAALRCQGGQQSAMVASYNTLLTAQKAALDKAYKATRDEYRTRFGKGWEDQFDATSTRVYNFFAQSQAQTDFCPAAQAIADQARVAPGASLDIFAAAVLPRLEQPFIDFYRRVDAYRVELADWNARYGGAPAQPVATAARQTPVAPASDPLASPGAAPATPPPRLSYAPLGA